MYVGKGKLPACLRKGARDPNHFGSSLIMARTKQITLTLFTRLSLLVWTDQGIIYF